MPLGFTPLDKTIGGGLRAGELLLIGGAQGTGKTTMALQMARNIASSAARRTCSTSASSTTRSTCSTGSIADGVGAGAPAAQADRRDQDPGRAQARSSARGRRRAARPPTWRPTRACARRSSASRRYGQNLFLLRGSQTATTVDNMRELIDSTAELSGDRRLVVFVDYLQKVPLIPEPPTEAEKVTYVVNGLKDIALVGGGPDGRIVAADKEGLKAARLRNHHLRGSSAINYEADIILILNEKYQIVAKVNIEFNPYQAQRFRDWVIVSVEKNRGGQDDVDLEYREALRVLVLRPERPPGPGEAHRGAPLQRLSPRDLRLARHSAETDRLTRHSSAGQRMTTGEFV